MSRKKLFGAGVILLMLGVAACHNRPVARQDRKRHQVEVEKPGGLLYVDGVDPEQLVREERSGDKLRFVAYKIGFYDSTLTMDKNVKQAAGAYYQYGVSHDWRMVLEGDSVAPVWYYPVTALAQQVHEGILVFELPEDRQVDTLVYTDATGAWGTQIFDCKKLK